MSIASLTGRVLVVDDHPLNLRLASVLLSAEGHEVETAIDAGDALARIAERPPDVILMDIQLPGTDGLTLTRRLKEDPATADIVVVALTAFAMSGDEQRALDAGCDGYIAKPYDTRRLAAMVADHVARTRGAAM